MKLSKLIAVGALALACLAFASPAVTAADVIDHPACGFELVDPGAPVALGDAICAFDMLADTVVIAALNVGGDDEAAVTPCTTLKVHPLSGALAPSAMISRSCRLDDPGWRIS